MSYRLEIRHLSPHHAGEQTIVARPYEHRSVAMAAFRAELALHPAAYRVRGAAPAHRRPVLLGPDHTTGGAR